MFEPGDLVVHQRHGAGVVIPPRIIVQDGKSREYFCIELSNERGLVMIPAENVNMDEIRPALVTTDMISEVLTKEPESLSDDHRARQNTIKAKIKTRDPRQLAQALRDLAWREHIDKLTFTDSQLKDQAQRLLVQELALEPSTKQETVQRKLDQLIRQAMTKHEKALNA